MRIAVLGGSFDPVHHGHLVVGAVSRELLEADELRWIPAGEQPFKVGRHGAPAADRARMVELAVGDAPGFVVDRVEVDRPGPSYTVETLAALRQSRPDARLMLLLGSDAAQAFGQWRDPAGIRAQAEVVIFARGGEAPPEGVADRVIPVPRIDISSTALRERVRSGRSIRYFVPEPVADYIAEHRLYQD
ncbi:MAG: nicotinate-nucleotide adenylyltransferase [Gemmatimonadales bacterium]